MTTIGRTRSSFPRIGASRLQRLASTKRTESPAWLMTYARSAGARRMFTVWSTAPERGTAQ
jgi:hypothetical protein